MNLENNNTAFSAASGIDDTAHATYGTAPASGIPNPAQNFSAPCADGLQSFTPASPAQAPVQAPVQPYYVSAAGPVVPPVPKPPAAPFVLSADDSRAMIPAALIALACALFMSGKMLLMSNYSPALGGTLFYVIAACGALYTARGKLHYTTQSVLLLCAYFILALSFFVSGDTTLRFWNMLLLPLLGLVTVASLRTGSVPDIAGILQAFGRFFTNLFPRAWWPVKALSAKKTASPVLIALLVSIPLCAVVLSLLSSADIMFSGLVNKIFSTPDENVFARWIWRCLRFAAIFMLSFSLLTGLNRVAPAGRGRGENVLPGGFVGTVLLMLDIIYIVFVAVQFKYFFGGSEVAEISGGYAEYARNGFFELVTVAAINLICIFPSAKGERGAFIKALNLILVLCTGIMTVSALMRMSLYVAEYGLSLLRYVTYWGIGMIFLALLAAAVKIFIPSKNVLTPLIIVCVLSWALLCCAMPDRIIAGYNYNAAQTREDGYIDVDYIYYYLSPDALPVLKKLADDGNEDAKYAVAETGREIGETPFFNRPLSSFMEIH